MDELKFRKAGIEDMENVYRLSNDPDVRSVSIHKQDILWEDHVKWYINRIFNNHVLFLIAYTDMIQFLGQVRFDEEKERAVISLSIVKDFRNKGFGEKMIAKACEIYFQNGLKKTIAAYIQTSNAPSLKIFVKAGFEWFAEEELTGNVYDVYILEKDAA